MLRNPIIIATFGLSIVLILIATLVVSLGLYGLDGPFIIHFNYLGEADFIGGSADSRNIIIIAAVTIFTNTALAFRLYSQEKFLAYVFSGASLLISIFTLTAAYLISSVN